MAKVQIVGLQPELAPVLAALHRLGRLQLIPLAPSAGVAAVRPGRPDRDQVAQVAALIERLEAVLAAIGPAPLAALDVEALAGDTDRLIAGAAQALAEVEPIVQRLVRTRTALEAEVATLAEHEDLLVRFLPLAEGLLPLEGFETVALIIQPGFQFVVPVLRAELADLTQQQCELVSAEAADGKTTCLVIFNRRFAAPVHRLLQSEQLSEVHLPPAYHGRPFRELLDAIGRRRAEIPGDLEGVRQELATIGGAWGAALAGWRAGLLDRLDELQAIADCLQSDHAFALAGWIAERDLPALEQELESRFDGRVLVERQAVGRGDPDEVPVLVENPRLVRPFEVLLGLLPPPRYGTIDPTPFVALFFPLLFGVMLADIGYGLVLLALAAGIRWRRVGPPVLRPVAQVAQIAALVAIAFGFVFGEFFGDLGHRFGLRPLLVDRAEAIPALLLFSMGLGLVQVAIGLALGAINGHLERNYREAVSRAAMLVALVLVFVLVGVMAERLPAGLLTPSLVLLAVALALLVSSVGLMGPLEVLGVVGNVLSYTRLVAVGLASVILAQVANQLAGLMGSILLGAIVGGLFHALNLALGLFSPSVQSLRLQYVEFFGRFLQSGGRPFHPFRSRLASSTGPDLITA